MERNVGRRMETSSLESHCDLALGLSCTKPPTQAGFQRHWLMTSVHKGQRDLETE